jgi:hypothetical protein
MVGGVAERAGVRFPDHQMLEMANNSRVLLRGYARGRGTCVLTLGFDLLVSLSEAEVEAVVAHEMAHARLVQRGYKGWLLNGLQRMSRLGAGLSARVEAASSEGARFYTARILLRAVEFLGRGAARLIAA